MAQPHAVERVSKLTRKDLYGHYIHNSVPVIITDIVTEWPAFKLWTPEYLRKKFHKRTLKVSVSKVGRTRIDGTSEIPTDEFFDRCTTPQAEDKYLNTDISSLLAADLYIDRYIDHKDMAIIKLLAGCNTISRLHYHQSVEAFFIEIIGSKKFLLYPPNTPNMYPRPWWVGDFQHSEIADPHDPGEKCKKFNATPIECEVRAGEMLYIPIHWWHTVYGTQEFNVALTAFWFHDGKSILLSPHRKLRHLLSLWRNRPYELLAGIQRFSIRR